MTSRTALALLLVGSALVACGDDAAPTPVDPTTFPVGGGITGLVGTGLVLANNAGDDLPVTPGAGNFAFATPLATGATYAVTVKTQPAGQTCAVADGSGTVATAAVTSARVTCTTLHTVSAHVTDLLAGTSVVLQNNGQDDLTITTDGATQAFATAAATGVAYAVTVLTNPTLPVGGSCTVAAGSGVIGESDVVVEVACGLDAYVDVATGLDTNPGTAASPWKTITHAIAAAPATGANIHVAAGTYTADSGETFPLKPRSNQTITGNVATPAILTGSGSYVFAAGDYVPRGGLPTVIAFVPGVTGAGLSGISLNATAALAIAVDGATVSLDRATTSPTSFGGVFIGNGAHVTITGSSLSSLVTSVDVVDPTTTLKARGSAFSGRVSAGLTVDIPCANLDLGTAADPGGNSLLGGASSDASAGVFTNRCSGVMNAVGNAWVPLLQGADARGQYASALVSGPTPAALMFNYYLGATASIQL